ncbi:MAG: hypothetical protein IAE77_18265 [Prosthecobacter sp.]|jgi:hypothetical protein|uniref:response regulator receiver domain n=1 Tax=Prosthecobacter sp. TaxID=1965333 RepID=UPI0019D8A6C8|nr:response regulator receiver domain [Prosthecobacter sp.]MBE2285412.1 hypothetical protein [Prosthecobacter sp.]
MTWTELQDNIAQRYCGTVLVLDDEICRISERGEVILDPLFLNAKTAFEAQGMLCDLRQVNDDFDDVKKVAAIERQLSRCDTVVLDWYLGAGKDTTKDPSNALRILEQMSSLGGFRFAVIQSKEKDQTIVDRLKTKFESQFAVVTPNFTQQVADPDRPEIISEDEAMEEPQATPSASPTTYRLAPALYVSVVSKERDRSSFVDIPLFFLSGLKAAYPDHLHWVGFDFASRVRELLPQLLESLPKGTDVALVFQALLQGDGELGDSLVEALAEEIVEMLRAAPLLAAKDETLIDRIMVGISGATHDKLKSITADFLHASKGKTAFIERFGPLVPASGESEKRAAQRLVCEFAARSLNGPTTEAHVMTSHGGYASLREHFQTQSSVKRLYPGVVLRANQPSANKRDWLLCLSPACDCARGGHEREYLFVHGQTITDVEQDSDSALQTCIATEDTYCHVKWSSKWFTTKSATPSAVEGYTFHTRLRDDFVRLLTQKVFGWQSRAGVNSSEYLRIMRNRT